VRAWTFHGWLVLAAATAVLPFALLHPVGDTTVQVDGLVHLLGVGVAAGVAASAAFALTLLGARCHEGRTVLLGTAFTVMAGLLAVHGRDAVSGADARAVSSLVAQSHRLERRDVTVLAAQVSALGA